MQLLLDRGLGAAGVAIDPAPPRGVVVWEPSAFRSLLGVLCDVARLASGRPVVLRDVPLRLRPHAPRGRRETRLRRAGDTRDGPRLLPGALSLLDRRSPATIRFANRDRAPLLLVAGLADHIVPASVVRRTFRRYRPAADITDYREFDGMTHWIIAQAGWEAVAALVDEWLERRAPRPAGASEGPA